MDKQTIVVTMDQPTEAQANQITDRMQDIHPHADIVVKDSGTAITELPALDDYVDEIADRVVDKLADDIGSDVIGFSDGDS